ncbi:MAG: hypothetical protein HY456_02765 [Parcubacteria group bacterium]|nr:hypothetical protein [Parcubacteria group bacterium]
MKKNTTILIIAVVVIMLLGLWWWQSKTTVYAPQAPTPPSVSAQDTTGAINKDLNSVTVDDIDKEFKNIDSDLNSL